MLAESRQSTGIIFSKSEKGREEMAKRCHGLSPMQRRVLILIDGSKDLGAIAAMVSPSHLEEILPFLAQQGFIEPVHANQQVKSHDNAAPVRASNPPVPAQPALHAVMDAGTALTDDASTLRLVKDFMTMTAQTYLGLLSAPVIQRIEQTKTAEQLMSVAGHWNMALRDSQQGKRFASPYLEQVKAALVAGAKPALGEVAVQTSLHG